MLNQQLAPQRLLKESYKKSKENIWRSTLETIRYKLPFQPPAAMLHA